MYSPILSGGDRRLGLIMILPKILLPHQMIQQNIDFYNHWSKGVGYPTGTIAEIQYANAGISAGEYNSKETTKSYISRLNYSFNDLYFVTANFRQDKSSKFLCLYTSKIENNSIKYKNGIIKVEEDFLNATNTQEVFEKLYSMLAPGGLLTTYCSKGDVRRAMKAAGFNIEKIPGPPGKREMVRARKMADDRWMCLTI